MRQFRKPLGRTTLLWRGRGKENGKKRNWERKEIGRKEGRGREEERGKREEGRGKREGEITNGSALFERSPVVFLCNVNGRNP